jgi:manganese/zinc/iron transport system substrate-binding protein
MRYMSILIIFGLIIMYLCMHLLYHSSSVKTASKGKIVCTTGMIASVVHEIAGNSLDIICLMGPGVDPHIYKAKPTDVVHIQEADLLLYNGLHLEGQMVELFEDLHATKKVFAVSSFIDDSLCMQVDEHVYDPHIWHDVSLWQQIVMPLKDQLCTIFPDHAEQFNTNALHYLKKLKNLHHLMQKTFATIPVEKRILVTAHDAFGYFGKAYGFEVVALQGVSTDVQPGLADITKLMNFIIEQHIPVVFIESCVPKKSIETVVQMAERLGRKVQVGKELLADALGSPEKNADSYIGMMYYNMYVIMDGFAEYTT